MAVTQRRTTVDFAHQMRWLVDEAYPRMPVIRVVLDNLNTHRKVSLYQTFPAGEARRIPRMLEFHYTPKHGSWLNMAEIEFSIFSRSCLKQRLPDEESPPPGGPRPGIGAKRSSSPHQLALQHPGCQNQTPSPLSHQCNCSDWGKSVLRLCSATLRMSGCMSIQSLTLNSYPINS